MAPLAQNKRPTKYVIIPPHPPPPPKHPRKQSSKTQHIRARSLKTNGRQVRHYPPHPPTPPNTQESNLPKRSRYERRNARSVPAPGKSRLAITVTITACRVKSKNVANVSYLPRFLASPNLSRRGPDPAGSGKHCKIVPVNEPACRV